MPKAMNAMSVREPAQESEREAQQKSPAKPEMEARQTARAFDEGFFAGAKNLLRHYRQSYCRLRRGAMLRLCLYSAFWASCATALLFGIWLWFALQDWKQIQQSRIQGLFAALEQQHGVQIRFELDAVRWFRELALRDVQVRLEVPLRPLRRVRPVSAQSVDAEASETLEPDSARLPHLRSVRAIAPLEGFSPQGSQPSQPTLGSQPILDAIRQIRDFAAQRSAEQTAEKTLAKASKNHIQLYVRVDYLRLQFNLSAWVAHTWRLLQKHSGESSPLAALRSLSKKRPKAEPNGAADGKASSTAQTSGRISARAPVRAPAKAVERAFAWQLFLLLEDIQKLSLGQVELELYTQPNEPRQTPLAARARPPRVPWQDFLQGLRTFPIEIRSLKLDFLFGEQSLLGENIRLKLGPLPKGAKSQRLPRVQSAQSAQTDETGSDYLVELQGKFSSAIKGFDFWGQLRARGALRPNLSAAYLIVELEQFESNYGSLRPMQFRAQYQPESLEFQALSEIRKLDWQLRYEFASRALDLHFWAEHFRLEDYLAPGAQPLQNAAFLEKTQMFRGAELSGEAHAQIKLGQTERETALAANNQSEAHAKPMPKSQERAQRRAQKNETGIRSSIRYRANLQTYLPQKALWLRIDGEGDTKAFQAQNIEMRQKNWRVQFRGDLGYQNLLPNGRLSVEWQAKTSSPNLGQNLSQNASQTQGEGAECAASYRGAFWLQRTAERMLRIETLRSRLDLPFLAQHAPAEDGAAQPLRVQVADKAAAVELHSGLPPWAQPQLGGRIARDAGGYRVDAQLLIPLSREQLAQTERVLGETLYDIIPLYAKNIDFMASSGADRPAFYRLPILRIGAQLMPPQGERKPIPEFSGLSGFWGDANFLRTFPALIAPSPPAALSLPAAASALEREAEIPELRLQPLQSLPPLVVWLGSLGHNYGHHRTGRQAERQGGNREAKTGPKTSPKMGQSGKTEKGVGSLPLAALFGGKLAKKIEAVLPGGSRSHLRLRSSVLGNGKDFGFWLDELRINEGAGRELLAQGRANARQLNLKTLELRWNGLALDNRFVWNIADESGAGQLVLQGRDLRYELQRLELPRVGPTATKFPFAGAKRAWLLRGDYALSAYLTKGRYQIAFERLPLPALSALPTLPNLPLAPWARKRERVAASAPQMLSASRLRPKDEPGDAPKDFAENLAANPPNEPNFLSAKISGTYAALRSNAKNYLRAGAPRASGAASRWSWKLDLEQLRLDIAPRNRYFPSGGQLHLAGSWEPGQLSFRRLAWEEPQRLLAGEGALYWIRPQLPLPLAPSVSRYPAATFERRPNAGNSPNVGALPFGARPPAQIALESRGFGLPAQNRGYWLGRIRLRGQRSEAGQREARFAAPESLEIEFSSERQSFRASGRGRLDATRFSQMSGAAGQKDSLESGSLRFALEADGVFRAPKWLRPLNFPDSPNFQGFQGFQNFQNSENSQNSPKIPRPENGANIQTEAPGGYLRMRELSGSWELADARYDGIDLAVGSKILWRPKTDGIAAAWLLSGVQGRFGRLQVERSFFSLRETAGDWNVSGLLNYIVNIRRGRDYRSSIALELNRSSRPRLSLPSGPFALKAGGPEDEQKGGEEGEQEGQQERGQNAMQRELLRWQGSMYSYPLRAYTLTDAAPSGADISALASNLRDNVFNANTGLRALGAPKRSPNLSGL